MGLHILKRATPHLLLLLMLPFFVIAQKSISGKIASTKNNTPLGGVTVLIKGTTKGTSIKTTIPMLLKRSTVVMITSMQKCGS